jgi:phosphoglycerate dehydrogenase-like enzyme
MAPAIHVHPPKEFLTRAVEAGGGRLVALEAAEGLIWGTGDDLPELPPSVRWVQLQSAGVEGWMERVAATPDVQFTSAGGAYAPQVAEHALALLLAGVRGVARYVRARSWDPRDDRILKGSSVAVIGAGGIGRELITRLEPLEVEIIAVTRSGRDGTLPASRLDEVWATADHFVICAPATDGTRHLVGADELAAMKPHSWVVNIARGALIDTDALVQALEREAIGGAALDVTDPEPLPDEHPLWRLALITPHVANPSSMFDAGLAERVRENVRRFGAGEDLLAPVAADRGY